MKNYHGTHSVLELLDGRVSKLYRNERLFSGIYAVNILDNNVASR